ncbi:MAG: Ig-like domain-containing protein [Dolichospermum sp.]
MAYTNTTALGVWASSNTTVATINTSGVITAKQNGATTISYTNLQFKFRII